MTGSRTPEARYDGDRDATPAVKSSRASRETLERRAWAYCVTCAATWTHDWALAAGAEHARVHRHVVEAAYYASYVYRAGAS